MYRFPLHGTSHGLVLCCTVKNLFFIFSGRSSRKTVYTTTTLFFASAHADEKHVARGCDSHGMSLLENIGSGRLRERSTLSAQRTFGWEPALKLTPNRTLEPFREILGASFYFRSPRVLEMLPRLAHSSLPPESEGQRCQSAVAFVRVRVRRARGGWEEKRRDEFCLPARGKACINEGCGT